MSGVGMVSSLGLDSVSSCAAARAGLRRMAALDFEVLDDDEQEVEKVKGHTVPLIASGFFGYARLVELSVAALEDMWRDTPHLAQRRLGIILIAGAPVYADAARALEQAEAKRDPVELAGEQELAEAEQQRITAKLLASVLRRAELPIPAGLAYTLRGSCTTLVAALHQANEWLVAGSCDCCIVGAVDSLVDVAALAPLNQLRMLRNISRPVGLFPGEAACFLALERAGSRQALARLDSWSRASGSLHPQLDHAASRRRETLADVVAQAIAALDVKADPLLFMVNLNGDEHRAQIWGELLVRLQAKLQQCASSRLSTWLPCAAFGDTGAAISCMSIAWVARAWQRGYAPASRAIACLFDDVGGRAAISMRAD